MNTDQIETGSRSDNSDDLLDLEEGIYLTPLVDRSRRLTFATPRADTVSPEGDISNFDFDESDSSVSSSIDNNSRTASEQSNNTASPSGGSTVHGTSTMATLTPDPITQQMQRYFTEATPVDDGDFTQNEIVIKKGDRGTPGTAEYRKAYTLITTALEEKFGAAKHFIVSSRDGETDSGNTKYKNIQEQFVGNFAKLAVAEKHCIAYDLMEVLEIPNYRDKSAAHPSQKWGNDSKNLIKHWSKFELAQVVDWQRDSNRYGGEVNRQTSQWLQTFLYNSCTVELRACVDVTYESLEAVERGGAVYFYLILVEMFQMTTDVVTALKSTFISFRKEGLLKIPNENVSIISRQLEAVAVSLNEVDALPDEAPLDTLEGLSICSCSPFKETFSFQLTEERIRHLRQRHGGGESTLDRLKTILREANSLYNSLNTSNKWNVPHQGGCAHSCWNCGGNHGVSKCNKKKDQKKIAENKKKWQESKGKSGDDETKEPAGHYERKKWGEKRKQPEPGANGGVHEFNGVWHMLCNKGCGWNKTHTTGFHNQFLTNPSAFPAMLPAEHPYSRATRSSTTPKIPPTSQVPAGASGSTGGTVASSITLSENQVVIDKAKWTSVLDQHERTTESADVAALCGALKELLN